MGVHSVAGFSEPVSSWMHLVGALGFAVASVYLLRRGKNHRCRVAALGVFACSGVLLLSISGVYHMLADGGAPRSVFLRLDKAAIFVLIAGTVTPIQGIFFTGIARWGVIGLMWILAASGIAVFMTYFDQLPRGTGTATYLAMGWVAGLSVIVLWRRHGFAFIWPVVLGGVIYTVGAVVAGFNWPTLLPGVFGAHELWHFAVLAALACHWTFIYRNAASGSGGLADGVGGSADPVGADGEVHRMG